MYSTSLLVVLACMASCYGFFLNSRNTPRQAVCSLPSKPCRLQVTIHSLDGEFQGEMSTQSCRCLSPKTCSSDWSRTEHVISRTLISSNRRMVLNMMFCDAVQPQRYCQEGETALVVSGATEIPQNVESYNCRCAGHAALDLKKNEIRPNHRIYHSYVCEYHQPTCPRLATYCMMQIDSQVNYNCKCRSGLHCRSDGYFSRFGYCRP